MIRKLLASLTLLALVLVPLGAGAAEPAPQGTSTTSLSLGTIVIDGLPVSLDALTLGSLRSYASTDADALRNVAGNGTPFALAGLVLPTGTEVAARSDGTTSQPGQSVGLPGGIGTLTAGGLSATVVDGTASSLIGGIEGRVDGLVGGLRLSVPQSGASSIVSATESAASNGATLSGLELGLTDIIPLDVLEQLPLSVLLDLLDGLPIDLDLDLGPIVDQIRDLVDGLELAATLQESIATLNGQIDDVQDELDAALGQLPALQAAVTAAQDALNEATDEQEAAQKAVDDANAALTLATNELTSTLAQIADLGGCDGILTSVLLEDLCDSVSELEAAVAAAQSAVNLANTNLATATQTVTEATAALAAATTARNTLRATIDALQATLTSLTNQLAQLIDDLVELLDELLRIIPSINLTDLIAAIEDLIAGLAGLQLLAIDEIAVGVTTKATGEGSSATALCSVRGVELLGAAHEVASCDALQSTLAQLDAIISDLLAGLPIAASVAGGVNAAALPDDIVRVRGLTTTASPADQRDGDYYTASSAVRALDIEVQPLRLTQVTDGLLVEVTGLVDGALAQLGDLAGVDTSALEGQLAGLVADLTAALPVGDLTGILTPALDLEMLGLASSSNFAATGPAATPIGGTPPGSVAPTPGAGAPQTTAPTSPTPSGTLPRTGGGMGLAALLLLGLGGGSVYALRRRPAA